MQKQLKEERIRFNGFIELEQEEPEKEQKDQKSKLNKPIAVKINK